MTVPSDRDPAPLGAWLAQAGIDRPGGEISDAPSAPPVARGPDGGADGPPRRRRVLLWSGGIAAWLFVVALVAVTWAGGSLEERHPPVAAEVPAPAPDGSQDPPAPTAAPHLATPATAEGILTDDHLRAAAHATSAVRLLLTEPGGENRAARYLDHVTAEAVVIGEGHALVAVVAVVLEGRDGRWDDTTTQRYGVAVTLGPEPRLIGVPWRLPTAGGAPLPVEDGPDLAERHDEAAAGLADAGYTEVTVNHLGGDRFRPGLFVARLRARAPGDELAGDHEVLMREAAGGLQVVDPAITPAVPRASLPPSPPTPKETP